MVRTPTPLARIDDLVLPYLGRFARWLVGLPGRALRWERADDRSTAVRRVVAHPGVVVVAAAAMLCGAAVVHAIRYPELVRAQHEATPAPAEVEPVAAAGPRIGQDVTAYITQRHELLASIPGEQLLRAVVSFTEPVTAAELPLPDHLVVEILHLVIPAQELRPRQVTAGADPVAAVDDALARERVALDEEIGDLVTTLQDDLGDPEFERDYRERLTELEAAHAGMEAGAPVVFAAVVVATGDQLRTLAAAAGVRLVDVAGTPAATVTTDLHGLLPSDVDRATTGRAH